MVSGKPLKREDQVHYHRFDRESIHFLRSRYNHITRWVIADIVRRSAYRYPDKPALVFGDTVLTYAQLEEAANRVAQGLLSLGLQRFDRVAILAHNTIHHVLTWLGTAKAGGVYLAINYLLRGKDIAYCINHSEARFFIVEDALAELVDGVLDQMPTVAHRIWSQQGAGKAAPQGWLDFDAWADAQPAQEPDVELHIEDPVQMTYTSGTESLPKGVVLTNQSLMAQYMGAIVDGDYSSEDVNLNALPIFHCAQRDVFLTPFLWLGATNVLLATADVPTILEQIERHRATVFFAPPTVWIGLLRHSDFEKRDLSSVQKGYYGASIMPVEILKEIQRRLPSCQRLYNYYGQTELSPYHTILKPADQLTKPGSAGMGGLNMETSLLDDLCRPVTTPGVPGEICGRGPHVMLMYFKDPEKTEEAMAGGWFHSGDVGVLDQDRYITVVDRKKDMVKTGGENVSTREVEEVIYTDPRVSEVAVIGVPHPKWVEAVTAVVVPKAGENVTEEEILALCKRELAGFKVPKAVVVVEALPKTPTGKILKRDLRKHYQDLFR
ncbi:fatty-acyl-CoA synthase [Desulfacinum hydrothermale DSM 13146]|uniref:Fatty-acyl-CoA synthase n=1 Tax=Desulfacinum hydrothermale DSM 13146 TaxID=1121390 RepID=A0A1W1WZK3_9BACT|nr:acyl-CoA synthetase [Desulfacinum hydrothermale]SMC17075.1 fatty-acyl-CoA synthase [Desulfacinum hydrothermale DSM 13146]